MSKRLSSTALLGHRLRRERQNRGLTREQISQLMHAFIAYEFISPEDIRRYESGFFAIPPEHLRVLCKIFGINEETGER